MTNVFTPHIVASLMLLARVAAADPGVHDNDPETPSVASPVPRVEAKEAGGLGYVFPLQLGVGRGVSIADHAITGSVYWSVAVVATLRTVGAWSVFVGGGFGCDVLVYRKRDSRQAPDAIQPSADPGFEARVGLAHGTGLGAPRLTVKLTPQYAHRIEMDLPSERRGLGLHASVGVACPRCWVGPAFASGNVAFTSFAAFVPTELEYVYQAVPGEARQGVMLGWSL